MARMAVYLGGPMESAAGDRDLRWRRSASRFLAQWNVKAINPSRGFRTIADEEAARTPQEIVTRDLRDVDRADLLLVNFTTNQYPAIGTSVEIKAAYDAGTPVIAVWPFGYPVPVFLDYHAAAVFDNLDDALSAIVNDWMLP